MQTHNLLLRESNAALETRYAVPRPSTFDEANRTVEAVIASSAPVPRQDARGAFHEILDPAGLDVAGSRGASVLDSHNQHGLDNVLGVLDDLRVDGDEVVGTIRFSERAEIEPMVTDVRNGVIRHLSVGYEVSKWADGQVGATRTKTAQSWVIREVSFVSVPADRNARTRTDERTLHTRARQIRTLGRQVGATVAAIDDLIDRGASIEEAKTAMLFDIVSRGRTAIMTSSYNTNTMDNPEAFIRAAADGMYSRVDGRHKPSPAGQAYAHITNADLARECLRRAGISVAGVSPAELITRAMNTTGDYPAVLLNVFNKSLRDAYLLQPNNLRQLARETTAADFRTKYRIMLDASGVVLQPLLESGEYRRISLTDAKESYAVKTYGAILELSRNILVNDDMAAFSDVTRRLGAAVVAWEAQQLATLLVSNSGLGPVMDDGTNLFTTAHGNLAGSGAVISDASLTAARLGLRKQVGPGGGLISIAPKYLLVPAALETTGQKYLTTIQPVIVDNVIVWPDILTLAVEPRLDTASAISWYLLGDPRLHDGLEYAYLAGAPGPQTQSQIRFDDDALAIKVREDFGCGFVDFRSWWKNPGA